MKMFPFRGLFVIMSYEIHEMYANIFTFIEILLLKKCSIILYSVAKMYIDRVKIRQEKKVIN